MPSRLFLESEFYLPSQNHNCLCNNLLSPIYLPFSGTAWQKTHYNIDASTLQVHKAKLRTSENNNGGKTVAVKVQHNDVYQNSFTDMKVMELLGRLVDWGFPEFSLLWLVEETKINLPKELDFAHEAGNCIEAKKRLNHLPWLRVPFVWEQWTTRRVLVMDFEQGGFVNDKSYLLKHNLSPYKVFTFGHLTAVQLIYSFKP